MTIEFETGAKTFEVNDLILAADDNRGFYEEKVKLFKSFTENKICFDTLVDLLEGLLDKVRQEYKWYELNREQRKDFVDNYLADLRNWQSENY